MAINGLWAPSPAPRVKERTFVCCLQYTAHLHSVGLHTASCSLSWRTSRGECQSSGRVERGFYANPTLTAGANGNHRVVMETAERRECRTPTECRSCHYHSGKHRLNAFTALWALWATLEGKLRLFGSQRQSISLPNNLQSLFQMTASWRDQARVAFKIVHNVSWPHRSCAL